MIRRNLFVAVGALLVLAPTTTTRIDGQAGQAAQARVVALRGGTVLTVTKGTIPNGTVVLRDGKIAAVGANVTVPGDAEVIDTSGKFVSPGLIDAHSHIANDAINEGGTTVSSMTGMEDVLDATDINIYRELAGGMTVANVLHGSANPIGGKNQVIKLRWGKTRAGSWSSGRDAWDQVRARRESQGHADRPGTGPRRYPMTRLGVEFVIRDAFRAPRRTRKRGRTTRRTRRAEPRFHRAVTSSSNRSSRSSRAVVSCTPTRIEPTRS